MAAKQVWQHCVRRLLRSQTIALTAPATQSPKQLAFSSWIIGYVWQQTSSCAASASRGGVRTCSATGGSWLHGRQYIAAPSGRILGDNVVSTVSRSWNSRSSCSSYSISRNRTGDVPCSTLSGEELQPTHTSTETIVAETDSSVQHSVSEVEEIPGTPLVQAYGTDRQVEPGRVYVGGLPYSIKGDALRDGLRELCGKCGTVTAVHVAQHQNQSRKAILAGKHRGFAFVTMETLEQALEVIDKLNGIEAFGRNIRLSHGLKPLEPEAAAERRLRKKNAPELQEKKVFLGNLSEDTREADLMNRLQEYGPLEDVKLITELHTGKSRRFAFITFADEGQAMRAIMDLDGSTFNGSVIKANKAKYPQGY